MEEVEDDDDKDKKKKKPNKKLKIKKQTNKKLLMRLGKVNLKDVIHKFKSAVILVSSYLRCLWIYINIGQNNLKFTFCFIISSGCGGQKTSKGQGHHDKGPR